MADNPLVNQDEIERLLDETGAVAATDASERAGRDEAQSPSAQAVSGEAAPAGEAAGASGGDDQPLGQEEIGNPLGQPKTAAAPPTPAAPLPKGTSPDLPAGGGSMPQADVDFLLNQAEAALASVNSAAGGDLPGGVTSFRLEEFSGAPASTEMATLDLIRDVELDLKIELGRTHMYLEDVLKLRKGSVVPLDKLAGDPVDIFVNGRLVARGEVLVLNDNFCVRVAELIAGTNASA